MLELLHHRAFLPVVDPCATDIQQVNVCPLRQTHHTLELIHTNIPHLGFSYLYHKQS